MTQDTQHTTLLPGCLIRPSIAMGLLTLVEAGTAIRALQVPDDVAARVHLLLPLEFVAGLVWTVVFALATIVLVQQRPRARSFTAWSLVLFACYNMLRWLAFVQADYDRQRLPVLLLAVFTFVLSLVAYGRRHRRAQPLKTEKTFDDPQP
jgi:hypothetical protein